VAREDGEEADELAVRGPRRAVAGSSSSGAPSQAMGMIDVCLLHVNFYASCVMDVISFSA